MKGTVAKIASFGAFVSLDGDIDGLIHISQLSEDHVERVKDILKVADDVEARVIKVDKIERRIGLSIKAVEYSEEQLQKESQSFETLRPSSDLVGLEQAFNLSAATTAPQEEEWSPSAAPESLAPGRFSCVRLQVGSRKIPFHGCPVGKSGRPGSRCYSSLSALGFLARRTAPKRFWNLSIRPSVSTNCF